MSRFHTTCILLSLVPSIACAPDQDVDRQKASQESKTPAKPKNEPVAELVEVSSWGARLTAAGIKGSKTHFEVDATFGAACVVDEQSETLLEQYNLYLSCVYEAPSTQKRFIADAVINGEGHVEVVSKAAGWSDCVRESLGALKLAEQPAKCAMKVQVDVSED